MSSPPRAHDHRDDEGLARWLELREAADARSRSSSVEARVIDSLVRRRIDILHVLDLATGAGSNLRHLVPRLGARQRWLVVDRRDTLLRDLAARTHPWAIARGYRPTTGQAGLRLDGPSLACEIDVQQADLHELSGGSWFGGQDLVTASALLDLVSEQWLRDLARACRQQGAAALFTIVYNGWSACEPSDPDDDLVLELFNRHQRTDKGLGGEASGPEAATRTAEAFAAQSYEVVRGRSDWTLAADDAAMQRYLIEGWAAASSEMDPAHTGRIAAWRDRRLQLAERGALVVRVGHDDIGAWPAG